MNLDFLILRKFVKPSAIFYKINDGHCTIFCTLLKYLLVIAENRFPTKLLLITTVYNLRCYWYRESVIDHRKLLAVIICAVSYWSLQCQRSVEQISILPDISILLNYAFVTSSFYYVEWVTMYVESDCKYFSYVSSRVT